MIYVLQAQAPMMLLYMFIQDRRRYNEISGDYTGDYFIRPTDWVVHLILMIGHFVIVYYLVVLGNRYTLLSEEAYDVSVYKNLSGQSREEELFFHQTLNYSFNAFRTIEIRGIGVFTMSRLATGQSVTYILCFTDNFQIACLLKFNFVCRRPCGSNFQLFLRGEPIVTRPRDILGSGYTT